MRSRTAVSSPPSWRRVDIEAVAILLDTNGTAWYRTEKWYRAVPRFSRRTVVTDTTTTKVREHYRATGLTDRIKSALATITPEGQTLTVAQLAPLDQFHIRGILATA